MESKYPLFSREWADLEGKKRHIWRGKENDGVLSAQNSQQLPRASRSKESAFSSAKEATRTSGGMREVRRSASHFSEQTPDVARLGHVSTSLLPSVGVRSSEMSGAFEYVLDAPHVVGSRRGAKNGGSEFAQAWQQRLAQEAASPVLRVWSDRDAEGSAALQERRVEAREASREEESAATEEEEMMPETNPTHSTLQMAPPPPPHAQSGGSGDYESQHQQHHMIQPLPVHHFTPCAHHLQGQQQQQQHHWFENESTFATSCWRQASPFAPSSAPSYATIQSGPLARNARGGTPIWNATSPAPNILSYATSPAPYPRSLAPSPLPLYSTATEYPFERIVKREIEEEGGMTLNYNDMFFSPPAAPQRLLTTPTPPPSSNNTNFFHLPCVRVKMEVDEGNQCENPTQTATWYPKAPPRQNTPQYGLSFQGMSVKPPHLQPFQMAPYNPTFMMMPHRADTTTAGGQSEKMQVAVEAAEHESAGNTPYWEEEAAQETSSPFAPSKHSESVLASSSDTSQHLQQHPSHYYVPGRYMVLAQSKEFSRHFGSSSASCEPLHNNTGITTATDEEIEEDELVEAEDSAQEEDAYAEVLPFVSSSFASNASSSSPSSSTQKSYTHHQNGTAPTLHIFDPFAENLEFYHERAHLDCTNDDSEDDFEEFDGWIPYAKRVKKKASLSDVAHDAATGLPPAPSSNGSSGDETDSEDSEDARCIQRLTQQRSEKMSCSLPSSTSTSVTCGVNSSSFSTNVLINVQQANTTTTTTATASTKQKFVLLPSAARRRQRRAALQEGDKQEFMDQQSTDQHVREDAPKKMSGKESTTKAFVPIPPSPTPSPYHYSLYPVSMTVDMLRQSEAVHGISRHSLRTGTGSKVVLTFQGPLETLRALATWPRYFFAKSLPPNFLTGAWKQVGDHGGVVPLPSSLQYRSPQTSGHGDSEVSQDSTKHTNSTANGHRADAKKISTSSSAPQKPQKSQKKSAKKTSTSVSSTHSGQSNRYAAQLPVATHPAEPPSQTPIVPNVPPNTYPGFFVILAELPQATDDLDFSFADGNGFFGSEGGSVLLERRVEGSPSTTTLNQGHVAIPGKEGRSAHSASVAQSRTIDPNRSSSAPKKNTKQQKQAKIRTNNGDGKQNASKKTSSPAALSRSSDAVNSIPITTREVIKYHYVEEPITVPKRDSPALRTSSAAQTCFSSSSSAGNGSNLHEQEEARGEEQVGRTEQGRLRITARIFSRNSTVNNFKGLKRDLKLDITVLQYSAPGVLRPDIMFEPSNSATVQAPPPPPSSALFSVLRPRVQNVQTAMQAYQVQNGGKGSTTFKASTACPSAAAGPPASEVVINWKLHSMTRERTTFMLHTQKGSHRKLSAFATNPYENQYPQQQRMREKEKNKAMHPPTTFRGGMKKKGKLRVAKKPTHITSSIQAAHFRVTSIGARGAPSNVNQAQNGRPKLSILLPVSAFLNSRVAASTNNMQISDTATHEIIGIGSDYNMNNNEMAAGGEYSVVPLSYMATEKMDVSQPQQRQEAEPQPQQPPSMPCTRLPLRNEPMTFCHHDVPLAPYTSLRQ